MCRGVLCLSGGRLATYPKMTLAQLRTASRQRADMVNSTFISDAELSSYINASYFELYDLLVQKYGNDYYVTEYSFKLQGNVSRYPLPPDFFKLLGVDLQISGGPDGYVSLRPFMLAERNRYSTANVQTWIGVTNLRYRISGNDLWFTPSPQTGQTIRIWYIPRLAELVDVTTPSPVPITNLPNEYFSAMTVNNTVAPGDSVTINGVPFLGVAGSPVNADEFEVITGDSSTTAGNLETAIAAHIPSPPVANTTVIYDDVFEFRNSTTFTVSTNNPSAFIVDASPSVPIVGKMSFATNLSAGDTVQIGTVLFTAVDPIQSPTKTEFQVGSAISDTINNIQIAIVDYKVFDPAYVAPFPVLIGTDEIRFYCASQMYFACSRNTVTVTLYGTGTITPPVVTEPNTVADGISGWLEYVITDAAIKMLQKEESDTSVLQFQKAALIKRIEAAAENRDAGNPATIADVQWTNGTWPFGNGFGGGGGIP